jgi:hypothetical protein
MHRPQPQDPQFAEDRVGLETAGASRGHLMASPEEVTYALADRMPRPGLCRVGEQIRPAVGDLDCAAVVNAA